MLSDQTAFLARLMEREEIVSTAVGQGVAFPHARQPGETGFRRPCMVFGVCRAGTDFGAYDGSLTHVFVLCCSNSEIVHLRLLAKATMLLRKGDLVAKLRLAESSAAVMRELVQADNALMMSGRWDPRD
jgi:mannitol/fructose-specific phosphotransferase system IIA component (Ntr-type)